jgi:hypothetical protein
VTKISSDGTFLYKWVIPGGVLAIPLLWASQKVERELMTGGSLAYSLLWPALLGLVLYLILKLVFFNLLDEVSDGGGLLEIRRGWKKERIPLSQIAYVSLRYSAKMPRATLVLSRPCRFGQVLVFVPAGDFWEVPSSGGQSPYLSLQQRIKETGGKL